MVNTKFYDKSYLNNINISLYIHFRQPIDDGGIWCKMLAYITPCLTEPAHFCDINSLKL